MNRHSDPIERYLAQLKKALHGASAEEQEEILSDIRSLIQEHVEEGGETVDAVLARLGPAEALADNYRVEGLLVRAAYSSAPLDLIRAACRWSVRGLIGFATAALVFYGYLMGLAFLAVAILKPFLPANTGFFTGKDVFFYGFIDSGHEPIREHLREHLGYWIIPVSIVLSLFCFIATTRLARWIIRRRKPLIPFT